MTNDGEWWKRGVVYQVYPRSFQDTNGDGVGDLPGISRRLDYLASLGVDAIWISPIYPSPMADFGYDIVDYCDIDPLFGRMADFDRLVREAHARNIKLILDFVPNHTSDRHPWFGASRSSRGNAKRDWYIWRDPAPDGAPPNNWLSNFGGSAWQWDVTTGQYYYHAFLPQQPDLNWRKPEVRDAMLDVLRFWLRRGVDGFRIDVIWHLIKDAELRDNPPNPGWQPGDAEYRRQLQVHSADQPEVHDVIARMRRVVDEFDDRVLIGEIYLPIERLVTYYGTNLTGVHLPFNFQLIQAPWRAREIGQIIREYESLLPEGGWPNWVLGNHDKPRIAARVGEGQARVAAMLLLTLRGTPTMYYGDEIGLSHVEIPPERVQDPWEKNEPGLGLGRDAERTPMQWDASRYAGFSDVEPWLPLHPAHERCNVERLMADRASILNLYRDLIRLRGSRAALTLGAYVPVQAEEDVLAYERCHGAERLLVALNLGARRRRLRLEESGCVLVSTSCNASRGRVEGELLLAGNEGVIVELDGRRGDQAP